MTTRFADWLERYQAAQESARPARKAELILVQAEVADLKAEIEKLHLLVNQLITTRWLTPEDVTAIWDQSLLGSMAEPGIFEEEEIKP